MSRLRKLIEDGRVHVLDGAMGTMLYAKGVFVNVCYDELAVTRPELVKDVHRAYVRAGAEVIETNTFGANPVKLSSFGLESRTEELNRAAAALARQTAGDAAAVVGAIGPLGIRIEPFGPTSREEAEAHFERVVVGLVEGGVDGFVLETFADLDELSAAFRAVRRHSDLPVIAQMTVGEDGKTPYGTDAEKVARSLTELDADVIGLNCAVGPAIMLEAIERMAAVTNKPLVAQPNAGLPRVVGDRKIYLTSPDYMAMYARRMIDAGAKFVGGCCGTTPEHTRCIREVVATLEPQRTATVVSRKEVAAPEGVNASTLAERSALGRKLAARRFVITVELAPPKGTDTRRLLDDAAQLKSAGADAIALLDGARAPVRMGVIPTALILEREVGVETIIHYTCRDRNMLGMISDLLGASAAGLRNLLAVTGDPPRLGPYPDATSVFDIDSIGLTNVVYRLNHGMDPGGNPIGDPTRWVIGVAVNQGAVDTERELSRLGWKVDAGADFAITQPVFDVDQLERFLDRTGLEMPVLAGLWPLVSLRNAEFLAHEVPGVHVPERVLKRMRRADSTGGADAAREEGATVARELFERLEALVQGVQVSAPLGRVDAALEVIRP